MFKLIATIKKELLLLLSDKIGLSLMFLMPLLLVFIITIVQDSAYKVINENKISLLLSNQDKGDQGDELTKLLTASKLFEIEYTNTSDVEVLKLELIKKDKLTALFIPSGFTKNLKHKAVYVSQTMTSELGLIDSISVSKNINLPPLTFYHDPILQEAYCYSVKSLISSFLDVVENSLMIETIYEEVGVESSSEKFKETILTNKVKINQIPALQVGQISLPNSTQHNVPAWTIFAMFFMVISLGSNIVKEKINGSFLRLKTMPTSFILVLVSKMIVYMIAAVFQVVLIFTICKLTFPSLNLPELTLPTNKVLFGLIVLFSSLAAVSYALMIGTISKTQEQASGIGAISIIIFAAIGGIWVPTFVMPEYLQTISHFSPMYWCLEGFYILFLKGGDWSEIISVIKYLSLFIIICQIITYFKLKSEKLI